jgi:hypothetical protein
MKQEAELLADMGSLDPFQASKCFYANTTNPKWVLSMELSSAWCLAVVGIRGVRESVLFKASFILRNKRSMVEWGSSPGPLQRLKTPPIWMPH